MEPRKKQKRSVPLRTLLYGTMIIHSALLIWMHTAAQPSWWSSSTEPCIDHHPYGAIGATIAGSCKMLIGIAAYALPLILTAAWLLPASHTVWLVSILWITACIAEELSYTLGGITGGGALGMLGVRCIHTLIPSWFPWWLHQQSCILSLYFIMIFFCFTMIIGKDRLLSALQFLLHAIGSSILANTRSAWRLLQHQWLSIKMIIKGWNYRETTSSQPSRKVHSPQLSPHTHDQLPQYQLPHIATLWKRSSRPQKTTPLSYHTHAKILEDKLAQFGIQGTVTDIIIGPVVVVLEYRPQSDVPISKILAREQDLALALTLHSVRIIAPIPGKSVVGFECSRAERELVSFSQYWNAEYATLQLPLFIGVSTSGTPVILDLATLPHLLVAGATGSGKSVILHNVLISLLLSKTPHELRLILIDPKRLEFAGYADIAHLIFPIITDVQEAIVALRWAAQEMERRYQLLAQAQVTNAMAYRAAGHTLADLVIIIDEWADLIMSGGKEAEHSLVRLAQMARAAGIHVIVATQRPSVDVITGLIKANVPSRIACKVSSKIDSRTIIDCSGAERLLGKGDMLVMIAGAPLERMHSAYLTTAEIQAVVCAIRRQGGLTYVDLATIRHHVALHVAPEDAELYGKVVELVKTMDEISISALQRRLRIGYNRSARMIDYLEAHGMILPSDGAKARKVLR